MYDLAFESASDGSKIVSLAFPFGFLLITWVLFFTKVNKFMINRIAKTILNNQPEKVDVEISQETETIVKDRIGSKYDEVVLEMKKDLGLIKKMTLPSLFINFPCYQSFLFQ